jgi:cyclophilin family peptidyl-prolyl cis-trans isomerase
MQQRSNVFTSARTIGGVALATVTLAALTACGGGGGDNTPATVSTMSVAATKYGTPALVTINGTHLGNLSLAAPGCKNVTRLTTAPTASTDTTAYFSCTPSGAYTSTISAVTNGATVSSQPLTVLAPIVTMTVSGGGVNGSIVFNLKGNVAPITVDNFLAYVNAGFYTGTIIHRIVDQTNVLAGPEYDVVQAGSYGAMTNGTLPTPKATPYAPISFETTGGTNVQWTAAMARTNDLNSATSSFFFNVKNNTGAFDTTSGPGYAVFADVAGSSAIITQISQIVSPACTLLVGFNDGSCVPIPNVVVTSATQTQ